MVTFAASAGFGAEMRLQALPFQCSINTGSVVADDAPTAHTSLVDTSLTPERKSLLG
jgi:hypothetical protein